MVTRPGMQPKTKKILLSQVKTCSNLQLGNKLYAETVENGYISCMYLSTALLNMYSRCGCMVHARKVFDNMKCPDVVSWTSMILGYTENGDSLTALDMFARMRSQGCSPDSVAFVAALRACISLHDEENECKSKCLQRVKNIHSLAISHLDMRVLNTLLNMYSKLGSMADARLVFDSIKEPSVVSWTSLILGYAENGEGLVALDLFSRMKSRGFSYNEVTFVAALKACTSLVEQEGIAWCFNHGKQIHSEIGCHLSTAVQNTMISMYAKLGRMEEAQAVFEGLKTPTLVSWNSLLLGYAENGEGVVALELFQMMKFQGCAPDRFTYVAALKACSSLADKSGKTEGLEWGRKIHSEINCHSDKYIQTALIDLYTKCGSMSEARQVFDAIKIPRVESWNALIFGFAENGEALAALNVLANMKAQGCKPSSITYVAALKACTLLGALETGRKIHYDGDNETEANTILVTCLVDFYSKCGSLVEAQRVFDSHKTKRNLRTWTALLAGYSYVGDNTVVFSLFEAMQDAGFRPDSVSFLCILTSCSHGGLVEKAVEYFEAMSGSYGLIPGVEHYSCMVDILGRSNLLEDCIAFLRRMPFRQNAVTWMTVLGACRKCKNVKTGKLAFESLLSLGGTYGASTYMLMGYIYESKGMLKEQEIVLRMGDERRGWKKRSSQSCWTNEIGILHVFYRLVN